VFRFFTLLVWTVAFVIAPFADRAGFAQIARTPSAFPQYEHSSSTRAVPPSGSRPLLARLPQYVPERATQENGVPHLDLSSLDQRPLHSGTMPAYVDNDDWHFQSLPVGTIYKAYLAGVKESRISLHFLDSRHDGLLMDGTLGGRFGLFRYGTSDPIMPQGIQVDVETAAHIRLDPSEEVDVRSVDFRAGVLLTRGVGRHQTKFGYYHVSSHLADEYMIRHGSDPGFHRYNFARDVLILGHSIYLTRDFRIYAEAGWAFWSDISDPWEIQCGFEYAPMYATSVWGAPFFAADVHLREELDFGGNVSVQTGWAWRSGYNGNLLRIGMHYYNGKSAQYSFFNRFEEQFGVGIWYDF